jgi:hypothetical protein
MHSTIVAEFAGPNALTENSPMKRVRGIGSYFAGRLAVNGIDTLLDLVNRFNTPILVTINQGLTRLAQDPRGNRCIAANGRRARIFRNRRIPPVPMADMRYHTRDVNPLAFNAMRDVLWFANNNPALFPGAVNPINIPNLPPRHRAGNDETRFCTCLYRRHCNHFRARGMGCVWRGGRGGRGGHCIPRTPVASIPRAFPGIPPFSGQYSLGGVGPRPGAFYRASWRVQRRLNPV